MLDRIRIIELIKYPASATTEEQEELLTLSRQYTYSPLLKILNAKIASIRQSADTNQFLTSAAISAVDRANLKKYIQAEDWDVSTFVPDLIKNTEVKEEKPAQETDSGESAFQDEEITGEIKHHDQDMEEPEDGRPQTSAMETETFDPVHSPEISATENSDEEVILQEEPVDQLDERSPEVLNSEPEEEEEQEIIRVVSDKDEKETDAIPPQLEEYAPDEPGGKAESNIIEDQEPSKPEKTVASPPDLSEKKFEPVSPEPKNNPESTDPLASDLLNNIKEYRKSREFFEKLLKENDPEDSGKTTTEDKKKRGKKAGKKSGKKPGMAEHADPEDPQIKKNAEKSGQKNTTADPGLSGAEKPLKPESGREQSPEEEYTGDKSDTTRASIPPEPIEMKILEKVTEERKSEGYQVYEEEDPGVIREYLDKISAEQENMKKLKKEEQVEIIENFIKTDPRIKNVKSHKTLKEREDLSLPSVKFKDDIISENLANIMISQGKTEQAIDIYKKLIWKFPQKKTYFATQIEELKKKSGK